ncbi:tetratricopeptide repeat protein [Glaciecola petra]|uniref:Tetratricopeptide repeat protein n=1 Tax=Glaciecola petra TaxID=3075602 RepID=A0ABU2ZVP2_9ALTE|nr:tetratricopeptide repeat protein [Aestuariibacter sp. P117]MDT0595654.1 tetratricopeptide repeat protein [Aestuariibacter sp. P117]
MSVVNKMLNDLESRQQLEATQHQLLQKDYVAPSNNKIIYAGSFVVLTISLMLFSVTAYLILNESQATQKTPQTETEIQYEPRESDQYVDIAQSQDTPLSQGQKIVDTSGPTLPALITNSKTSDKAHVSEPQQITKSDVIEEMSVAATESKMPQQDNDEMTKSFSKAKSGDRNNNESSETALNKITPKRSESDLSSQLSSLKAQASMASRDNDNKKVMQILQKILQISPIQSRARKQLAAMLFSKSQNNKAAEVLLDGLAIDPQDSSMRLMLARIYFKEGNGQQAFSLLNSHPYGQLANDELLSFRAALAEKMGNYEVAQNDYLMLVQRNPAEAKWWLGLGVSHDKQSMGEQAIAAYQQAYSLNQLPQQVNEFVQKRIALLERRS